MKQKTFILFLLLLLGGYGAITATAAFVKFPTKKIEPVIHNASANAAEAVPQVQGVTTTEVAASTQAVIAEPIPEQPKAVAPEPVKTAAPAKPKTSAKKVIKKITCETGSFSDQLLCYINEYRKQNNLNAVKIDESLNAVALKHSTWMNVNQNFNHVGENGSRFFQRCEAMNTTCDAENLAFGFTSAKHAFSMWKASPSHNANLLGQHTTMGLGVSGKYATLLFR